MGKEGSEAREGYISGYRVDRRREEGRMRAGGGGGGGEERERAPSKAVERAYWMVGGAKRAPPLTREKACELESAQEADGQWQTHLHASRGVKGGEGEGEDRHGKHLYLEDAHSPLLEDFVWY